MEEQLKERKQKHLDICLDESLNAESGSAGLSRISLPHRALPELDAGGVSLETLFLGFRLSMPVMISCMTGGSAGGEELNRVLAQAASEAGIPVGTGSFRVMFRHPETKKHFHIKPLAPDVPVLGNIGAAQIGEYGAAAIARAARELEFDGLYVHLNSAQELFQTDGDRNFTGWYEEVGRLADETGKLRIPLLVKETGAGISPLEGLKLLGLGVSFIDVAGTGGTDWVAVEGLRRPLHERMAAESFRGWGASTAALLAAYRMLSSPGTEDRIIASGGLRTPRDFAAALACGAFMTASALPFARAAARDGLDGVLDYVEMLQEGLKAALVLTGAGSLEKLRRVRIGMDVELEREALNLVEEARSERE